MPGSSLLETLQRSLELRYVDVMAILKQNIVKFVT